MREGPKPSIAKKRVILCALFAMAVLHWFGFSQGEDNYVSNLSRASLRGDSIIIAALLTVVLHLCFVVGLAQVYELIGKFERAYARTLGILAISCCVSFILSETLFGSSNVDLYEPSFITLLFLSAFVFHFGILHRATGAIET